MFCLRKAESGNRDIVESPLERGLIRTTFDHMAGCPVPQAVFPAPGFSAPLACAVARKEVCMNFLKTKLTPLKNLSILAINERLFVHSNYF